MKTITDKNDIAALLPRFTQTILEAGKDGETIEHGHLGDDTARLFYLLPEDGNRDEETGEFLGDWTAHIVRMEIDEPD